MKLDQGFGAIGLLLFATTLALLLTIGIPVLLAPDSVKLSDWLGFAGALAGAMVTLIAAAFAWRAVQVQIFAQREIADRQSALVEFEALRSLCSTLNDEVRFMRDIRFAAYRCTQAEKFAFTVSRISFAGFTRELRSFEKKKRKVARLKKQYLLSVREISTIIDAHKRHDVYTGLIDLNSAVRDTISKLSEIKTRNTGNFLISDEDQLLCKQIALTSLADKVQESAHARLLIVEDELDRATILRKDAQKRAAL